MLIQQIVISKKVCSFENQNVFWVRLTMMFKLQQTLRSIIFRIGVYLDFIERRNDPRYQIANTHIGVNVSLGNLKLEGNNSVDYGVKIQGNVSLGLCSTLGHDCVFNGGDIWIGRYCQIGPHVAIYAKDHPIDYMTMYVNKRLFSGELQVNSESLPVVIGHDVWIGHGSIVLKGVKIGNGAIIGAGAVVTKDIPDYSVAVGNPARVIKKRFNEIIIGLLQASKWWESPPDELELYSSLFNLNLNHNEEQAVCMLQDFIGRKK